MAFWILQLSLLDLTKSAQPQMEFDREASKSIQADTLGEISQGPEEWGGIPCKQMTQLATGKLFHGVAPSPPPPFWKESVLLLEGMMDPSQAKKNCSPLYMSLSNAEKRL